MHVLSSHWDTPAAAVDDATVQIDGAAPPGSRWTGNYVFVMYLLVQFVLNIHSRGYSWVHQQLKSHGRVLLDGTRITIMFITIVIMDTLN